MSCVICTEQMQQSRVPKVLHCGHTFCLTCIENWFEYNKCSFDLTSSRCQAVRCPICLRLTPVPSSPENGVGVASLPTNFALLDSLEATSARPRQFDDDDGVPAPDGMLAGPRVPGPPSGRKLPRQPPAPGPAVVDRNSRRQGPIEEEKPHQVLVAPRPLPWKANTPPPAGPVPERKDKCPPPVSPRPLSERRRSELQTSRSSLPFSANERKGSRWPPPPSSTSEPGDRHPMPVTAPRPRSLISPASLGQYGFSFGAASNRSSCPSNSRPVVQPQRQGESTTGDDNDPADRNPTPVTAPRPRSLISPPSLGHGFSFGVASNRSSCPSSSRPVVELQRQGDSAIGDDDDDPSRSAREDLARIMCLSLSPPHKSSQLNPHKSSP